MFPGLTVDRFNDILVTQTLSLGIELRKEEIFPMLIQILRSRGENIRGIYERNDVKIRELEGMAENKGWFMPETVEDKNTVTEIVENCIRYSVDVENGQKTGFFLDQKYNRAAVARLAKGKAVLDWSMEHCQSLRADTHADNKIMQHLLEKNGFTRCGVIHVADGSPRFAYQKLAPTQPLG